MAIPNIFNVILISFLFFLIFGIIGINYFKGVYFYCDGTYYDNIFLDTKWDCLNYGGTWVNYHQNFDNIFSAMISLFGMANLVGWAVLMYRGIASRGVDQVPISKHDPLLSLFFIIFIIVGAFFILNLFVGVVISTYNREKEKLGKNFLLTKEQKAWIDAKLLVIASKPKVLILEPQDWFRKMFYKISENDIFEYVILVCILLNTLVLMITWYDNPEQVYLITDILNYFFALVFTLEAIIKLISQGKRYFKDSWNIFDLVIVIGTAIGLGISLISTF